MDPPARAVLGRKTIAGFAQLAIALALILFGPAWTLAYWQAWVYLGVFLGAAALITVYLWQRDPELLARRVAAGPAAEKEWAQQLIQIAASLAFVALLVVPSLDHRFEWSHVPLAIVVAGDGLAGLGFLIVFRVFRENAYTAATIDVAPGQTVVSTGPYALVRHPMYLGALVMLFGTPLALGSWWGLVPFGALALVIVLRLLDEERFLAKNLPGYDAYRRTVRYRLVPLVW
jgi:protein-S-isoprenylcysteine O-methyltransferase Ste14